MNIYRIINKINGKCYVGQTVHDINIRFNKHISTALSGKHTKFYNAIRKYGVANFYIELLETGILCKQQLDLREVYWQKKYNVVETGYNSVYMGAGGYNEAAVQANRLRKGKKRVEFMSATNIEKMKLYTAKWNKAGIEYMRNLSPDQRIINAKKANLARQMTGYTHTSETIKKISDSQKGKMIPVDQRDKISESVKRVWSDTNSIYNSVEYRSKLASSQIRRHQLNPSINLVGMKDCINTTESTAAALRKYNTLYKKVSRPTFDKWKRI